MIKHIVVWKLKDEAAGAGKAENARAIKEGLEGLNGLVPGAFIEVGLDLDVLPNTWDAVIYSEFEDLDALQAYQVHPEHQRVAAFVREVADMRAGIDYEV